MTCERIADILDACLDGEADALTTRAVEEHLAECPACSATLNARRALQSALREKLPRFTAPSVEGPWSNNTISKTPPRAIHQRRISFIRYASAAILLLAVGITTGLLLKPSSDPFLPLAQSIETDHLRSLQENHLLDVVSTDQHTVKPWFAGKLPFAPPTPDLPGFPLRGGRLDWVQGNQAAALVYARNQHTINLFIWPAADQPLPASLAERTTTADHHLVFWRQEGLNCCAISDLEAGQLKDFATAFQAATK